MLAGALNSHLELQRYKILFISGNYSRILMRAVSTRAQELETAKEILAEVFGARPGEVEEMIQRRLEESGAEEREEGRWPATFCLEK